MWFLFVMIDFGECYDRLWQFYNKAHCIYHFEGCTVAAPRTTFSNFVPSSLTQIGSYGSQSEMQEFSPYL